VRDRSTLLLKANFHLINVILMGLCSVFSKPVTREKTRVHTVSLAEFCEERGNICIYDAGSDSIIEVIEYEPEIFGELRRSHNVSLDQLVSTFAPINNIQAITSFQPGSGKSSSFFFFADNKSLVLKTLKDEERSLLLEKGVLSSYSEHVKANERSLLSKYLGIFTIRAENMTDVTCIIMDNLLGKDIASIERIYDLKGSTKGRHE